MRLVNGSKVVAVACVPREESDDSHDNVESTVDETLDSETSLPEENGNVQE